MNTAEAVCAYIPGAPQGSSKDVNRARSEVDTAVKNIAQNEVIESIIPIWIKTALVLEFANHPSNN